MGPDVGIFTQPAAASSVGEDDEDDRTMTLGPIHEWLTVVPQQSLVVGLKQLSPGDVG